jgi:hypothetical protein
MQLLNHLPITISFDESDGGRVIIQQSMGCDEPQEIHIGISQLEAVINALVGLVERTPA